MNFIDPTGHDPVCMDDGAGGHQQCVDTGDISVSSTSTYDAISSSLPATSVTPAPGECGHDKPGGCKVAAEAYYPAVREAVVREAASRKPPVALTPGQLDHIVKLILSQMVYESSFEMATGPAIGLMQVYPSQANFSTLAAAGIDTSKLGTDRAVNIQAGVHIWFNKLESYGDNDPTRAWDAVQCYVGCQVNGNFVGPNSHPESQLYVPRVIFIYKELWGV